MYSDVAVVSSLPMAAFCFVFLFFGEGKEMTEVLEGKGPATALPLHTCKRSGLVGGDYTA